MAGLRHHLAPFEVDGSASHYLFSADCGTSKVLAGGKQIRGKKRLYKHTLTIYHGRSGDEMAGRLISSVRDMVTAFSDQHLRVRAAGIMAGGRGVLLPSVPNPHLPALAAALVRRGGDYVGDEIVYVDPVLRHMRTISTVAPLPLLLDTTDLAYFPWLDRTPGREGRTRTSHKPSSATDRVPLALAELGGRPGRAGPVTHLIFPVFDLGGPTMLQRLTRSEAVFGLAAALLNPEIWTDRALLVLRDLAVHAQTHRLVVGSYDEAADLVLGTTDAQGGGDR